jgi:hypothetical protein
MARPVVTILRTAKGTIVHGPDGEHDQYEMPREEPQTYETGSAADIEALRLAIQRRFKAMGLPMPT